RYQPFSPSRRQREVQQDACRTAPNPVPSAHPGSRVPPQGRPDKMGQFGANGKMRWTTQHCRRRPGVEARAQPPAGAPAVTLSSSVLMPDGAALAIGAVAIAVFAIGRRIGMGRIAVGAVIHALVRRGTVLAVISIVIAIGRMRPHGLPSLS